jgi:hypothetical protein
MATVYLQPGTGTGSGTLSDPYYYSELTTAQNAATSTGTTDGVVILTDGNYESSNYVTIGALGASSTVTLEFKSLNRHGATFKNTHASIGYGLQVGTYIGLSTIKFTDFQIYNFNVYSNVEIDMVGIKQTFTGVSNDGNGLFRCTPTSTITNCEYYHAPTNSAIIVFNRSNNTTVTGCSFFIDSSSATSIANTGLSPETYKNTIISSNNGTPFTSDLFGTTRTNCCFNNVFVTSASSGATDCIDGDPQYVSTDSASPDLRLRPTSPCINAGTAS